MRPAVVLLLALLAAWTPARATTSGDLCPGASNPCVLACAGARVDVSTALDFGQCDLVFAATARLRIRQGTTVRIAARSIRLASGAQIDASGDALNNGARVIFDTSGAVTFEAGTTVDVTGKSGGAIFVIANDGDVRLAGTLATTADGASGYGATVSVTTSGAVTVDSPIDTTGGTGGGGDIDLDAGAVMVNAGLTLEGSSPGGGGGDLSLSASHGSVVVLGPVSTAGARGNVNTGGGTSGDVAFSASGDINVLAPVTATGGGPDGDGGNVDIDAGGAVVLRAGISASTVGTGSGGAISISAAGPLTSSSLAATGGSGGDVDLAAGTTATVRGPVDVSSTGGDGTGGGITVQGNPVLVTSKLSANADTRQDSAGSVGITGCGITIVSTGELDSRGVQGRNLIQGSGAILLQGDMNATPSGSNRIEYRDQAPTFSGPAINPAATVARNPALLPCPGSIPTTTTTTSTSTVTTSSRVSTTQTTIATSISTTTTTTTLPDVSRTTTSSTSVTTSTVAASTTSTSATTLMSGCVPPDCDDGDLCTMDACVKGTCGHAALVDIDAVTCRLDGLVAAASATPVGRTTAAVRGRLLAKLDAIRRGVERARPQGRRRSALFGRADRRLKSLEQFMDKAVLLHRLDPDAATTLWTLADQARAAIAPLRM